MWEQRFSLFGIEDDDAKIFPCEIILFKGAIENIFVNNKCQIEIFYDMYVVGICL